MTYLNGELPDSVLVAIPWSKYKRVNIDILYSLELMGTAFKARFGRYPFIISAYRTKAHQQILFDKYGYPRANYPGKSDHGWGTALDIYGGVEELNSPEWRWMSTIGRTFGFRPLNEKNKAFEPWHWVCRVPMKRPVGVKEGKLHTLEIAEDEMFALRNYDGSIGMVNTDLTLVPLTLDVWNAALRMGALTEWHQENDGTVWNILTEHTARVRLAEMPDVDENALAQQLAALLVPAVIAALPDSVVLTEEEVEAVVEKGMREVLGSLDAEQTE